MKSVLLTFDRLILVLMFGCALGCQGIAIQRQDSSAAPHIVLILADDLGWGDPAGAGPDSLLETPSLDRIAAARK